MPDSCAADHPARLQIRWRAADDFERFGGRSLALLGGSKFGAQLCCPRFKLLDALSQCRLVRFGRHERLSRQNRGESLKGERFQDVERGVTRRHYADVR